MAANEDQLRGSIGGWPEVSGRVLVIVNSPADRPDEVALLFDRLHGQLSRDDASVIAPLSWRRWLGSRSWPAERVLFACDSGGVAIELNYFLEQLDTLRWILSRRFDVVMGSAPHSLYNEEIKDTFERRVALFLGDRRFVAHALPGPFLYSFGLADIVRRLGRGCRLNEYRASTRALVDDLRTRWVEAGQPERADLSASLTESVLARHLSGLLPFDEERGLRDPGMVPADHAAELISYIEGVWRPTLSRLEQQDVALREERKATIDQQSEINRRDILLAELANESVGQVQIRDGIIAQMSDERRRAVSERDAIIAQMSDERRRAVSERDAIIDQLRREVDRLTAGWRRVIVGRPKV